MSSRFTHHATTLLLAAGAAAAFAGCFVVPEPPTDLETDAGASTGASSSSGALPDCASGVPADVRAVIGEACGACHGSNPSAPMALVTVADWTAAAPSDPSVRVADVVAARMTDAARPMPPAGLLEGAERDVVLGWIADGLPEAPGECTDAPPTEPPPTASVCTSGAYWGSRRNDDDDGDARMNPGRACIACHEREEDDELIVGLGGTVYPTLHEPDLCYGAGNSGAVVVVDDASGRQWRLPVNETGNFALHGEQPTFPIRAKVVVGDTERVMQGAQDSGDCNGCHTADGAHGAPGRIVLP